MRYTIQIYRHLYDNIPPLFPNDILKEIQESLEQYERGESKSLEELENEMVKYGHFVWPWHKAYRDFIETAEYKIGEQFLLSFLDESLQEKYNEFKEYGGTWHDLHSGRPAEFFSSEERAELMPAMVESRLKLREYVNRELVGLSKKDYLIKVEKYNQILNEIQIEIARLKNLIRQEEDHPMLANEMREKIREIEHGLCLLGKELRLEDIQSMSEFYKGRKADLNRMRGINVPLEIDLYE